MKRSIFVELFEQHEKTSFYTIRFQQEAESETDNFFSNFDTEEFSEDIDIIIAAIDKIGEVGAEERRFRPEGGRVKAIPLNSSSLRLYVYCVSDEIVILGNGGLKQTATYQEDPKLSKYVKILRAVGNILMSRLENNSSQLYNRQLMGNLKFIINDKTNEEES